MKQRIFCGLQPTDVDERQHDADNHILRAVREQPQEE
jgi:hypothetical protein